MKRMIKALATLAAACVACAGFGGSTPLSEPEASAEVITWQASYVSTVNAEAEIVDGGYSDRGNTLEIKPKASKADVYLQLPIFEEYDIGEKVHISFRIKSVELSSKDYDVYKVRTWGGMVVDYAFRNNVWDQVNFDGTVLEKDGVNTVLLSFTDLIASIYHTISISEFKVDDDTFDTENLFGGVEVIQYEGSSTQMMGYLFVSGDDVVVYDGGYTGDGAGLIQLIHQYGRRVSGWFISHFHGDHITALQEILEGHDIFIDTLYYDFPVASSSLPEGKSSIEKFNSIVAAHSDKIGEVVKTSGGDEYLFDEMTIKVLNSADVSAGGSNYGNNTTVVYKVETPGESVLLFGDLGESGDKFIANEYFLSEMRTCRVISMAHHGQNGVSKNVYDQIDDIKVCLYSAPQWLYDVDHGGGLGTASYKTLEVRSWMRERGVRVSLCTADGRLRFD